MPISPIAVDPQYRTTPFRMFNPMEGFSTGNPVGDIVGQMFGNSMFQGSGYFPGGMGHQNMYDRMESYRLQQLRDEVMARAAQRDQRSIAETLIGVQRMTGGPLGQQQMDDIAAISNRTAAALPTLTQFVQPQLLDQMMGYRGSSAVMTDQMFHGARFRLDPVTGKSGMSGGSINRMTNQVWEQLFNEQGYRSMGLSAGEAGMLFSEMTQGGMMPGGMSQQQRLDTMLNAGLADSDTGRAIRDSTGLSMGQLQRARRRGSMDPEMMETMKSDPNVQAALSAFDTRRVTNTLEDYSGAVNAMREIFGDAGRTNAPMPELLNALQELTGGALTQINPADVENMARTTRRLANNTGLGLGAISMMTEHGVQMAQAMGLPPIFAADALQGGLAFRGAGQQEGIAAPTWGQSGLPELSMRDQQLRLAAAQSRSANQANLAFRLEETAGGFRANSMAAEYLQAIRGGQTEFAHGGQSYSINLRENLFRQMIMRDSNSPITEADINQMLMQQPTNLEYGQREGTMHVFRRAQPAEAFGMAADRAAFNASTAIGGRVPGLGGADRLGAAITDAAFGIRRDAQGDVLGLSGSGLSGLGNAERSDREIRNQAMVQSMRSQLNTMAAGGDAEAQQLLRQMDDDPNFAGRMAENIWGSLEQSSRDPWNSFGQGSAADFLDLMSDESLNAADVNRLRAQGQAAQASALAPLRGTGAMRTATQAVIDAEPGEGLYESFMRGFGGQTPWGMRERLMEEDEDGNSLLGRFQEQARAFDTFYDKYESEDAEGRQRMRPQLDAMSAEYHRLSEQISGIGAEFGVFEAAPGLGIGQSGEQILRGHLVGIGDAADSESVTEEQLKAAFGDDWQKFAGDLDAASRHHRARFAAALQEGGAGFELGDDGSHARKVFRDLGQTVTDEDEGESQQTHRLEGTLTLNEDGTATVEGEVTLEPRDSMT